MRRAARRLTDPLLGWLDRRLAARRAADRRAVPATLDPGATLTPEAVVENGTGDPAAIRVGARTVVRGRLVTLPSGGTIRIGADGYVGHRTEVWSMAAVTVGDRVLISHGVNINDASGHSMDAAERAAHVRAILTTGHPRDAADLPGVRWAPIVIEDDVWISFNVTVLRGVRIGARSVIAAGSVVTRDVPPDTLYRCAITPVMTPLRPT